MPSIILPLLLPGLVFPVAFSIAPSCVQFRVPFLFFDIVLYFFSRFVVFCARELNTSFARSMHPWPRIPVHVNKVNKVNKAKPTSTTHAIELVSDKVSSQS
ncbi:hypothetical protein F4802DRAFT_298538 [Xylaria palmicola]|nr:hypothetical protein F4802DRAFT_298538 [Xylaria palmicola]